MKTFEFQTTLIKRPCTYWLLVQLPRHKGVISDSKTWCRCHKTLPLSPPSLFYNQLLYDIVTPINPSSIAGCSVPQISLTESSSRCLSFTFHLRLKAGSEKIVYWLCRFSILLGFVMSKKLRGLWFYLLIKVQNATSLVFLTL